jgi:lambda repressor-like predicted transcriptional regulator
LVVESEPGRVEVLINSAAYLIERHALPQALEANLLPVEGLVAKVLGVEPEVV